MSAYSRLSTDRWVSGVARDGQRRIVLQLESLSGQPSMGTLSDLAPILKVSGAHMKRVVTAELSHFEPTHPRSYLKGIGHSHLSVEGQEVYALTTNLGAVVVPAQLLIVAMFGTNALTRPYLLSPLGMHMAMQSFPHGRGVQLVETPMNPIRGADDREYARKKLQWALNYPSAAASWGSLYARAASGRVGLRLPRAEARLKVTGVTDGESLYATAVSLVALTATEEPMEFARGKVPREFVFHEGLNREFPSGRSVGPPASTYAPFRRATSGDALTDAQWRRVEPLVRDALAPSNPNFPGQPLRFPLRYLFDILSFKFGLPVPWSKVAYPRGHVRAAKYVYLKLMQLGRWDAVAASIEPAGRR